MKEQKSSSYEKIIKHPVQRVKKKYSEEVLNFKT